MKNLKEMFNDFIFPGPPCLKQEVKALIISKTFKCLSGGSNKISRKISECPRKGMKTGEGYEKCKEICGQESHAEISAIENAEVDIRGAPLYLMGHSYCCDECLQAMRDAGLESATCIDSGKFYSLNSKK